MMGLTARFRLGGLDRGAIKETIVRFAVSDDLKVLSEPRFPDHGRRITAHWHRQILFESVMIIQLVRVGMALNASPIDGQLSIVFARVR